MGIKGIKYIVKENKKDDSKRKDYSNTINGELREAQGFKNLVEVKTIKKENKNDQDIDNYNNHNVD